MVIYMGTSTTTKMMVMATITTNHIDNDNNDNHDDYSIRVASPVAIGQSKYFESFTKSIWYPKIRVLRDGDSDIFK